MSQPVKLSDELVLDARLTADLAQRSIAGQIEFWASLGRAVEPLLRGDTSLALRKCGDEKPLSQLLAGVPTEEGRQRVTDHLASQPFPHYEADVDNSGHVVRIEENGRRTIGRFVNRQFQPMEAKKNRAKPTAKRAKEAEDKRSP